MKPVLAVVLMVLTTSAVGLAQSAGDREKHHAPQQEAAPPPTQPAPPSAQPGTGTGMIGGGMIGSPQGTMGRGGMMGGNVPMANMMQMMGMIGLSGGETGCGGMSGLATIDRVEGRIAFLKAELRVTDAQSTVWNAFADALRTNAKGLGAVRASKCSHKASAIEAVGCDTLAADNGKCPHFFAMPFKRAMPPDAPIFARNPS